MIQNILVAAIIIATLGITIFKAYKNICKKDSSGCNCSGCTGCSIKPSPNKMG